MHCHLIFIFSALSFQYHWKIVPTNFSISMLFRHYIFSIAYNHFGFLSSHSNFYFHCLPVKRLYSPSRSPFTLFCYRVLFNRVKLLFPFAISSLLIIRSCISSFTFAICSTSSPLEGPFQTFLVAPFSQLHHYTGHLAWHHAKL